MSQSNVLFHIGLADSFVRAKGARVRFLPAVGHVMPLEVLSVAMYVFPTHRAPDHPVRHHQTVQVESVERYKTGHGRSTRVSAGSGIRCPAEVAHWQRV